MLRNYIFDLDGTLLDSAAEILKCLRCAFYKSGVEIAGHKLNADLIGPPIKEIVENVAPNLDVYKQNEVITFFRQIYDNDVDDISIPYAGILELLKILKMKDCNLFIATSKPQKPTLRILSKLQMQHFFRDVYTIDKFSRPMSKKEMISKLIDDYKLDLSLTAMFGDTFSDVTAAKNSGVRAFAVLWGYAKDKKTLQKEADTVLHDVCDILNLL